MRGFPDQGESRNKFYQNLKKLYYIVVIQIVVSVHVLLKIIPYWEYSVLSVSSAMPKKITNPKIACLDFSLQKAKMKLGVQVLVEDPEKLDAIRQR